MSESRPRRALVAPPGALPRPNWETGGTLTAGEIALEKNYLVQRLRRHLRTVHGWGIVCGLNVVPALELGGWNLFICPGYGIGPCGDEIYLRNAFAFDLRDYLWMQPANAQGHRVWISIEGGALEVPSEPQHPNESYGGCGCGRPCRCGGGCRSDCGGHGTYACAEGMFESLSPRDRFRIMVSWSAPAIVLLEFDLCSEDVPLCPPCPDTCALPLASVLLPALSAPISVDRIDTLSLVEK
jgi:hypothetical protein